jgi:hypothetical protein
MFMYLEMVNPSLLINVVSSILELSPTPAIKLAARVTCGIPMSIYLGWSTEEGRQVELIEGGKKDTLSPECVNYATRAIIL